MEAKQLADIDALAGQGGEVNVWCGGSSIDQILPPTPLRHPQRTASNILRMNSINLTSDEVTVLTALMGDIQVAASAFYAKTATSADVESLGTEVRTFLSAAQTLNERLGGSITEKEAYQSALYGTAIGELINAIKYVRNVSQHVLHVVRPSEDSGALVGGLHGLRIYVAWDEVPPAAHDSLRPRTQSLRPAFEARLRGQEVTGTMLSVLRAFATLAPQIVHRDQRGEWTGFPLKTQPSMPGRLHPDEPEDLEESFAWLNSRPPNGDARLVVGQVTVGGRRHLLGYTVDGRLLPGRFVESSRQVTDDIASGFRYLSGDPAGHVKLEHDCVARRHVLRILDPISEWAAPLGAERSDDWGVDLTDPEWARMVRFAQNDYLPDVGRYEVRRSQRLNA
ncbi:hypothetical protein ARTSIC4J27_3162 [Pseudarthrobacter siccitolerans]|uniref:Uncharacterized protein n=1 Tax=Pseudarthrobacter siccitolerans TaxID=861266 RepID=A0A024H5K0_9MICC|nr:hypothetical protein [Pseudarthrobacter siccitolerans]CCQ47182.1 hypothetical protein ARTSIC4J27_3162 [Pseudarthrobacter siccitolerans]